MPGAARPITPLNLRDRQPTEHRGHSQVLPAMKKQALDMWEQGRRLTGHPGLPLEPTPNLGAAD